jgi:hypothetical protein
MLDDLVFSKPDEQRKNGVLVHLDRSIHWSSPRRGGVQQSLVSGALIAPRISCSEMTSGYNRSQIDGYVLLFPVGR